MCDFPYSYMFFLVWQGLEDVVVSAAQRKFYEKYPDHAHWTLSAVDEWILKVVDRMKFTSHLELKN